MTTQESSTRKSSWSLLGWILFLACVSGLFMAYNQQAEIQDKLDDAKLEIIAFEDRVTARDNMRDRLRGRLEALATQVGVPKEEQSPD